MVMEKLKEAAKRYSECKRKYDIARKLYPGKVSTKDYSKISNELIESEKELLLISEKL